MQSKIDEFYEFEGNYCKWIDMGDRYEGIQEEIVRHITELETTLTEEQKKEIELLSLLFHRREDEAKRAAYKGGFKTGLALALEAISDEF